MVEQLKDPHTNKILATVVRELMGETLVEVIFFANIKKNRVMHNGIYHSKTIKKQIFSKFSSDESSKNHNSFMVF